VLAVGTRQIELWTGNIYEFPGFYIGPGFHFPVPFAVDEVQSLGQSFRIGATAPFGHGSESAQVFTEP
jgi:hypothetical protein